MYDGLRHVLFLLPPLAVLAGFGASTLCWLVHRFASITVARLVTTAAIVVPVLPGLVLLHPYQTSYFSPLVGGIRGAEGLYEIDYWGASYREAIEWLNANASDSREERPTTVLIGSSSWLPKAGARSYADSRFEILTLDDLAPYSSILIGEPPIIDYYIATKRLRLHQVVEGTVVFEVKRQGATLCVVKAVGRRLNFPG
jgi:hypothetical protein